MYHALIIDNDITQLNFVKTVLENRFPDIDFISADSFQNGMLYIKNPRFYFDFFLMDVCLEKANENAGIVLAEAIRKQLRYKYHPIIFLSSHIEYMCFAQNNLHCINYIQKPYHADTICQAVAALFTAPLCESGILLTNKDNSEIRITSSDIFYIQAHQKGIIIQTIQGDFFTRRYTLKVLETQFEQSPIFRCHKSYLVNRTAIKQYDRSSSTFYIKTLLKQLQKIPIGKSYQNIVTKRMCVKNYN